MTRVIAESDVVRRREVDDELVFAHDGTVEPNEIVEYQGRPYRVENAELLDNQAAFAARAYFAPDYVPAPSLEERLDAHEQAIRTIVQSAVDKKIGFVQEEADAIDEMLNKPKEPKP
jgi:hypothetical protein